MAQEADKIRKVIAWRGFQAWLSGVK